jgi:bifunctional DNA-binding transcriptional regulator/antitoxin component of YhaV-PrlF toxin-antitoxin module
MDLEEIVCIEETAITVRSYRRRTTVPSKIFKFMGLKEGDILRWIATKDGTVFVKKSGQKKDGHEEK